MSDELDELRRLLGASEQVELEEVKNRIEDYELRAKDIADVLAESIHIAGNDGDNLRRALESPVEACIQTSVRRDTQLFADALFPVMGPAIRRSIVETLKGFVESINRTVDQSFSPRGLGWRLEAMRTGVPFAEVVLKHTLVYRVEEVFLIHKETGLLIEHVAHDEIDSQDSDAVSGMLTAIRDFVNDSFSRSQSGDQVNELGRVDMGEQVLWMVHGPYATLAAVVRGVPPVEYQDFLKQTVEGLHASHSSALEAFMGDEGTVPTANGLLTDCLWDAYQQGETKKAGFFTLPIILILLSVLALMGWSAWSWYQDKTYRAAVMSNLDAQPGIVLMSLDETDDGYRVRGLRDPLSEDPKQTLATAGIASDELAWQWRPFQSLDSEIVLLRARRVLEAPESVSLSLSEGVLSAKGVATQEWQSRAAILAQSLAGVHRYDFANLYLDSADTLRRALVALRPESRVTLNVEKGVLSASGVAEPEWVSRAQRDWSSIKGVKKFVTDELQVWDAYLLSSATALLNPLAGITLEVKQRNLQISGVAPLAWKRGVRERLSGLDGLRRIEMKPLQVAEYVQARKLAANIEGRSLSFVENISLYSGSLETLDQIGAWVQQLQILSEQTGIDFLITVTGYTDKVGTVIFNQKLSVERANEVVAFFVNKGFAPRHFVSKGHASPLPGIENRRVVFSISLTNLQSDF